MSHGEHFIVPTNLVLIGAFVVSRGFLMPFWTTLIFALPLALILAYFGVDKYGGMQLVIPIAAGLLPTTTNTARQYHNQIEAGIEPNVAFLLFQFSISLVITAVLWIALMMALAALLIGGSWLLERGLRKGH